MYSNSTFLTPSTSNSCLCVLNNRLPRLARYLQAVFIVTNSFGRLNKLELETLDFVDFICLLCVSPKVQTTCSFMQDKETQTSQKFHTSLPVAEMALVLQQV